MFYQLLAYYTFDKGNGQTLWDYLGTTVMIFQNAAALEVSDIGKAFTFNSQLNRIFTVINHLSFSTFPPTHVQTHVRV